MTASMGSLTFAVIVAATLLAGCRHPHLGPGTGRAYRDALDAQIASQGDAPTFGADDAHRTMAARRGEKPDGGATTTTVIPSPITTVSGPSGQAVWPGAAGNITLEAR